MPKVVLGRTGVLVSRMGVGTGPFWRNKMGPEKAGTMMHRAMELGINYFDTAPNYGDEEHGYSEEMLGPTVKEVRDRIFLVSKTEEATYDGTWKLLRQSLKRLQTDHLDLVHLHNFGHQPRWPDLKLVLGPNGALGALREAKKQGVVRFIGASGHLHPSRFHAALDTGDIDILMNAVNFVCQHTYDFEHKVWSRASREGVACMCMKTLGGFNGGGSFRLPEEFYERAIRYSLSIPGVTGSVIGVKTIAELEKAAKTVAAYKPLSVDEARQLAMEGLKLSATDDLKTAYGRPLT